MKQSTRVALVALAAVAGAALSLLTSDRWRRPPAPDTGSAVAPVVTAPAPPNVAPPVEPGELRIASHQTIQIDAASLAPGRPVVLRLVLGEPSRSEDPRPVRVISAADSRVFEGEGILSEDRSDARFEIDPAFLSPGRYIVEVKTTERSHFPLRRYALEVR